MLNNTENIEARLCAFVEGDLDEAARAEIEKHLETHPAHRALLDELKRTKTMMLSLPRELAPVDMAETLQGHLERSVLLDGVGTSELDSTLKVNRWPQLMALAAVVLLAVGLGVLVYVVLPNHSSTQTTYVLKEKVDKLASTQDTMRELSADEKAAVDAARDDKELGKVGSKPSDAVAMTPTIASPESPAGAPTVLPDVASVKPASDLSLKGGAGPAFAASADRRFDKAALEQAKPDGGVTSTATGTPAVCVVVSTDNFETTNSQLASYLATKNIAWQAENPAAFFRQTAGEAAIGSRLANTQVLAIGGANDAGNAMQNSKKAADSANQYNGTANNTKTAEQNSNLYKDAGQLDQLAQNRLGGMQQEAAAQNAEPTTAPAFDLAAAKSETVIIAHSLTRQQAAELSNALGKLYAGQSAVVVDTQAANGAFHGTTVADAGGAFQRRAAEDKALQEQNLDLQQKLAMASAAVNGNKDRFAAGSTTQPTTQPAGGESAQAPDDAIAAQKPAAPAAATPSTEPSAMPVAVAQQQATPSIDLTLAARLPSDAPADVMIIVQSSTAAAPVVTGTTPAGPITNGAAPAVAPPASMSPAIVTPTSPAADATPTIGSPATQPAAADTTAPADAAKPAPAAGDVTPAPTTAPSPDVNPMDK